MADAPAHRPSRTGIEIGFVFTICSFLLGLSFSAGIQYAKISQLDARTVVLQADYDQLRAADTPIQVRLEHIETLLSEIQNRQLQQQQTQAAQK